MRKTFILILFLGCVSRFIAQNQLDTSDVTPTYDSTFVAHHIAKAEDYLERSLPDSAWLHTDTALFAAALLEQHASLYEIYILRGNILENHPKKSAQAEANYLEAIAIAERLHHTEWQTDAMDCLYQYYLGKKQFDKALAIYSERAGLIYQLDKEQYTRNLQILQDSIQNFRTNLMSTKILVADKERELDLYKWILYWTGALALLFLLLYIFSAVRKSKIKKELNKLKSDKTENAEQLKQESETLISALKKDIQKQEQEIIKMRFLIGEQLREQHDMIKAVNHGLVDIISESRMLLELIGRDTGSQVPVDKYMSLQNLLTKASNETKQLTQNIFTTTGTIAERLESLCNSFIRPQLRIDWTNRAGDMQLSEQQQMALLIIANELLENIDQHSEATEVEVVLEKSDGKLQLKVDDNGRGFDVKSSLSKGRGIRKIIALVTFLNGNINIASDSRKGTHYIIEWPL